MSKCKSVESGVQKVSVERRVSSCYCQKVCNRAVMSLRWHLAVERGFVYLFYNDQRLVAGDGKDQTQKTLADPVLDVAVRSMNDVKYLVVSYNLVI